jgi:hypothetical protein
MACQVPMSFYRPEWGFDGNSINFNPKQKSRWLFNIENITTGNVGSNPLPCIKASRPKLQFKEMQAEHLNEIISYPSKPDWQAIQIIMYDRCITSQHPVMTWLKQQYDPTPAGCSTWYPCIDPLSYKTCATLTLMDGCGNIIEAWTIEHCYPQSVDFGELDMTNMEIITADVTLKYDRAFQTFPAAPHVLYTTTQCVPCPSPICDFNSGEGLGGGQLKTLPPIGFAPTIGAPPRVITPDFSMV